MAELASDGENQFSPPIGVSGGASATGSALAAVGGGCITMLGLSMSFSGNETE